MPHEFFEDEKVRTILIMVSGKGMPEGVAGKAVAPSKFILVETDIVRDTLVADRFGRIPFLGKKEIPGPFLYRQGIPVLEDELPGSLGKLGVSGRTVLRGPDQDPASGMFDVGTFQMTDFPNAQAGGEHQAEQRFKF